SKYSRLRGDVHAMPTHAHACEAHAWRRRSADYARVRFAAFSYLRIDPSFGPSLHRPQTVHDLAHERRLYFLRCPVKVLRLLKRRTFKRRTFKRRVIIFKELPVIAAHP